MQLTTHTDEIKTVTPNLARRTIRWEPVIVIAILIASFLALVIVTLATFPEVPLCKDSTSSNCYWDKTDPANGAGLGFVTVDGTVYKLRS